MWEAMQVSVELAIVTTVLLLLIAIPLAYLLAFTNFRGKTCLEAVIALPIVLPPTVLGYFMLMMLAPQSILGSSWSWLFDASLAFSFAGIVIASVVYSLPFAVQPIQQAFRAMPEDWIEMAQTQGLNALTRLHRVILPASRGGLYTAVALVFAHTMGEFGVVLMVGGSIAGETKVASIYLFEQVELLQYDEANIMALILLCLSFIVLSVVYSLNQRWPMGGRS
ncbi:MAG: molybdate ABC transporter permease subunit [Zetaproteobacteria bacterium CG_4_9_14_3_um_filter_53_7]|nr:MAG: molybdate ABC transporter permease subunit [Zetaproteobacteria bacterium CG_4_9_14_3_um_filter_53_7]